MERVNTSTPKLLGGIGTILILISPFLFITGIVGLILVAVAMHKFSEIFKEKDIFNKYIVGLALGFISLATFYALGIGSFLTAGILSGGVGAAIAGFGFGLVLGILLSYILGIASGYYYKKAYESLSKKTGQKMFATGGLLWFIGQILVILFGLGFLLILVALVLIAISYFTLPSEAEVF